MHQLIRIANAKKLKKQAFFNKKKTESDSDADLTSDDEEEVSKNMVGEFFNNRYFCLKYLGRGTFSRVWLVYDFQLNTFFAMKIQFEEFYKDSLLEIKFMKKINNLDNENSRVVKLYDSFVKGQTNHLIYELLGCTLLEVFKIFNDEDDEELSDSQDKGSTSSEDESNGSYEMIPMNGIKRIIKDILKGLYEAHSKKIIHTDLKPENVMLNIVSPRVELLKEWFLKQNPSQILMDLITNELPDNFLELDKSKRKGQKKKAKLRALNKFKTLFNQKRLIKAIDKSPKKYGLLDDIEKLKEFLNNDVIAKIVDFGNGEIEGELIQEEISLRCYRCPENIINEDYNVKSDIWVVGCMCYELITGEYLFDIPRKKKSIDRNREHLRQMYEVLGKMPRYLTEKCDFSEDYFDQKGRIIKNKDYDHVPINDILVTEFNFSDIEADNTCGFLEKLLEYDPKKRFSARQSLDDEWLNF